MRIAFFALTGVGNEALKALLSYGIKPQILITRTEPKPYPYYDEINIVELAKHHQIPTFYEEMGETEVLKNYYDVILVCTYHRKITKNICSRADFILNFHPSLLPEYRGACPFYWVIRNGEKETGVTVHKVEEQIDLGDILLKKFINVSSSETQGSLRKKLAKLTGKAVIETIKILKKKQLLFTNQELVKGLNCSHPNEQECNIDFSDDPELCWRKIRALSPYPGAKIDGVLYKIESI